VGKEQTSGKGKEAKLWGCLGAGELCFGPEGPADWNSSTDMSDSEIGDPTVKTCGKGRAAAKERHGSASKGAVVLRCARKRASLKEKKQLRNIIKAEHIAPEGRRKKRRVKTRVGKL